MMFSLPNGAIHPGRGLLEEGKDKPPSPASSSPRLSRKAHDDLTGTEKSGTQLNAPWTLWLDRSMLDQILAVGRLVAAHIVPWAGVLSPMQWYGGVQDLICLDPTNSLLALRKEILELFDINALALGSIPRTTASQYEATLKKVYTFSTIESFWGVYNNIPEPCSVATRYSYHLMRNESRPMWEDPVNKNGGVWKLKCFKWATNEVWKTLLLAVIGEQLSDNVAEGDDIMGVSVSIRENEDLIQIWNCNSQRSEEATVLERIKELMPQVTFPTVFYKAHQQHYAFEGGRRM